MSTPHNKLIYMKVNNHKPMWMLKSLLSKIMQYQLWISSTKAWICYCKHNIKSLLSMLFQFGQEDISLCGWYCISLQNLPPCWVTYISSSIIPPCIQLIQTSLVIEKTIRKSDYENYLTLHWVGCWFILNFLFSLE